MISNYLAKHMLQVTYILSLLDLLCSMSVLMENSLGNSISCLTSCQPPSSSSPSLFFLPLLLLFPPPTSWPFFSWTSPTSWHTPPSLFSLG